jgi:amino-acid N-acetyltransferase
LEDQSVADFVIRTATAEDASALEALILAHQREGHLLPRELADIRRHAPRFAVAESAGRIIACAELAPLSAKVAEVRSLVVAPDVRRAGLAARIVGELRTRAETAGFESLCAFTHDARLFVRHNFSIVPHVWLPEKIATDCAGCPLFRRCGQHAMILPLRPEARPAVARRAVA